MAQASACRARAGDAAAAALRSACSRTTSGTERIALPDASHVELAVPLRVRRARQVTLVRLSRNRLAVVLDRRGRARITRAGRTAATAGRTPHRRITARVSLDVPAGTVALRLGARRVTARLGALRLERRLLIAGSAGRVAVGPATVSWTAAAPPPPVSHAPAAPAPASAPVPHAVVAAPAPNATPTATPTPAPVTTPEPTLPRPFAPTSVWNAPLAPSTPIDPDSGAYVADLQSQMTIGNPWINTNYYSTPVYTVPADQPTVPVRLDTSWAPLQSTWQAVPVPPEAVPAVGTDAHLVVYQPSLDRMWEFWRMGRDAGGNWHARWGGTMNSVSTDPGYFEAPNSTWGATATSLPLLGGLMRIDELRSGHIDHALAMALPQVQTSVYRWPAQRTDGRTASATAIPEGMRFRLDPSVDVASLGLPPMVRMMAEAAQRYGIVVRDYSANVAFFGEDPTPTGANPYTAAGGIYGGKYPNRLLEKFPWGHLQALADVH